MDVGGEPVVARNGPHAGRFHEQVLDVASTVEEDPTDLLIADDRSTVVSLSTFSRPDRRLLVYRFTTKRRPTRDPVEIFQDWVSVFFWALTYSRHLQREERTIARPRLINHSFGLTVRLFSLCRESKDVNVDSGQ